MNIFVIGFGDIGQRVAQLELGQGHHVTALARRNKEFAGVTIIRGDLDLPATMPRLPCPGTVVYYFAPPPVSGVFDQRMRSWLEGLVSHNDFPDRIIYISTTGVYGDCKGAWVDEQTPPAPSTDRAMRRLDAEKALRDFEHEYGVPVIVLRVPGIYGPGRWPIERLRQGGVILRAEDAPFSNRIHADDLARVCMAAARRGQPGTVYNATDGQITTMTEYFHAVADAMGLPRLTEVDWQEAEKKISPGMLSYLKESRRIKNSKMLKELDIALQYPNLSAGLAAAAEDQSLL